MDSSRSSEILSKSNVIRAFRENDQAAITKIYILLYALFKTTLVRLFFLSHPNAASRIDHHFLDSCFDDAFMVLKVKSESGEFSVERAGETPGYFYRVLRLTILSASRLRSNNWPFTFLPDLQDLAATGSPSQDFPEINIEENFMRVLHRYISELQCKPRRLMRMVLVEGKSVSEIVELTGNSPKFIKNRTCRYAKILLEKMITHFK